MPPKKTYPFRMESFISDNPAVYIVGLLSMIAVLLYRLNENSSPRQNTNKPNSYNRISTDSFKPAKYCPNCSNPIPLQAHMCIHCRHVQPDVKGVEKRYCRTCNARVSLDATVCLACDDEP